MKIIYLVFLLIIHASCTDTSKSNDFLVGIENTKSDAIEMHDILMAKMGDLGSLKQKIMAKDSLIESNRLLIDEIELADKAMWDWMHQFKVNYEGANDSLTLIYFQNNLSAIYQVKLKFDSAFLHGHDYLD